MYQILDRKILHAHGADSIEFFNSLCTNKLEQGKLTYCYFLNAQGKYLYDSFVFAQDHENLYLDIDEQIFEEFFKYIQMRKMRRDFVIDNISDKYRVIYSRDKLAMPSMYNLQDPRSVKLGYRACVKMADLKEGDNLATNILTDDRYKHSIVEGCEDMEQGKSIPIEFLGEEQNALSFDKGCYVGQEVISRAKYQGVVRKSIYIVNLKDGSQLQSGDVIFDHNQQKIGKICSLYKNQAMALLYKDRVPDQKKISEGYCLVKEGDSKARLLPRS